MSERIALLASREGTTAEAVIRASQTTHPELDVALVISNNPQPGVFERVGNLNQEFGLNIQTLHISGKTHPGQADKGQQTIEESTAIYDAFKQADITLAVCLGYLRKIRGPMLTIGPSILNTHPGPLPETAGMFDIAIQEHVINKGMEYSAQTLHLVDEGYDTGRVVAVNRVKVLDWYTPQDLQLATKEVERNSLPNDIANFILRN